MTRNTINFCVVWGVISISILLKILLYLYLIAPPRNLHLPLFLLVFSTYRIHAILVKRFPYKSIHKTIVNVDIEEDEYKIIQERRNYNNDNKE